MANRHMNKLLSITNHQVNTNKDHTKIPPHTYQNGYYQKNPNKKQETASVAKDVENRKHLCTVGRNVNWCSHYGKQYGGFPKIKIELPYNPAILLLGIYQKKTKNINLKRYMYPYVNCSTIYNSQI